MTRDFLIGNWALVIASVLGTAVFLFVLLRLYDASPRGRLGQAVRRLRLRKQAAARARRRAARAEARLARLRDKAATIRPRLLSAADESVQDTRMLQNIADDQVLIAIREVREVIVEEFPPNRHDELRNKYL